MNDDYLDLHIEEFPYYKVYFKLKSEKELNIREPDFHTIKSILNKTAGNEPMEMNQDFHTIKSILNKTIRFTLQVWV